MSFPGSIYGEPDWAGMRRPSGRVDYFKHEAREVCAPVFGAAMGAVVDLGGRTLPASAAKLFSELGSTKSAAAGAVLALSSDIEQQAIRLRRLWLPMGILPLQGSLSKKRRGSIRA